MIRTISILPLIFIILMISVHSYGSNNGHLIGENLGDQFIYTNRKTWEKDYKEMALDKQIYRLGNDIVLFVGRKSSGKPDALVMTPSKYFTQKELKRFKPSSMRKDIPPRNHKLFKNMDERGFQSQNDSQQ